MHQIISYLSRGGGCDLEDPKDLIESYGEVSYEDVKMSVMQYVNTVSREAQDSVMLYQCIMSSLTKEAQRQVRIRGKDTPSKSPVMVPAPSC